MAKYRHGLPLTRGERFLTDGGMETTLIFHEGVDLPHFASFVLMASPEGRRKLKDYYIRYLELARSAGVGFVLDTPTWRASPDWADKLGYDADALKAVNEEAIGMLVQLRKLYERPGQPIVLNGAIGPRGDGYKAGTMNADEAVSILKSRTDIRIVMTDIDMPGSINGLRLAAVIRERWPPIDIVVVSGQVKPRPDELPSGSVFYSKPYDEAKIIDTLRGFTASH